MVVSGSFGQSHRSTMSAAATAAPSTSADAAPVVAAAGDPRKQQALEAYRKALKNHEQLSDGLKRREYGCRPGRVCRRRM